MFNMNCVAVLALLSLTLLLASSEGAPCRSAWAATKPGSGRLFIFDGQRPNKTTDVNALTIVAWASFQDDIKNSGWAYLEVESNENVTDDIQAYAAGALEAYLTRQLMEDLWENLLAHYCDNQTEFCTKLNDYLQKNLDYSHRNEERLMATDPYWNMVHLQMQQMLGLSDVFENVTPDTSRKLTNVTRALLFNIIGDSTEFEVALNRSEDRRSFSQVPACSALVKVVGDYEDIYMAHTTWFLYSSMLRIQKKYTFPWHLSSDKVGPGHIVPGHTITMSSYAGKLISTDDFYLTSAGLAVMETSLENNNPDLWRRLDPEAAPLTWVRGMVANRLASSGQEWTDIFARKNSGTYNNQWTILDYKLFTPGTRVPDNTLWILEQMPGITRQKDITEVLRQQTYWPSYNIAYFDDIFNISAQPQLVTKFGNFYRHDNAPRANIFRRDHVKVRDMNSMIALMRYNDYTHDPLSRCNCTPPYNPVYAISSRYDLLDPNGSYDVPDMYWRPLGATDMKLTNSSLFKSLEFIGMSGPTWDTQPAFQWSSSGFRDSHIGQPDLWKFGPVHRVWGSCNY